MSIIKEEDKSLVVIVVVVIFVASGIGAIMGIYGGHTEQSEDKTSNHKEMEYKGNLRYIEPIDSEDYAPTTVDDKRAYPYLLVFENKSIPLYLVSDEIPYLTFNETIKIYYSPYNDIAYRLTGVGG